MSIDPQEWRLRALERRLKEIEELKPAVLVERVRNLSSTVHDLGNEVNGLRKALYTVALSVTGSAVIFALTAWALTR